MAQSSYGRLAWSNLAAQSADQVALAAAPIVAVIALGTGPGETGLLQAAQTLPFLLLAIPAGMLADRGSRRKLMAQAETLRVAALVGILALAATGMLTWQLLALFGFVAASGTVAYSVAVPALVPALVDREHLAKANARIELARTVATMAGPALGGLLVGWLGGANAFGIAAALSAMAVLLLTGLREPARQKSPTRPALEEAKEGARFVWQHSLLKPVFVTQFVFNMAFFVLMAVFVPHAVQNLGLSAAGTGFTLAAFGVGMACGALAVGRVMQMFPLGTVIAIGPVCGFAGALLMLATTRLPSPMLAAAAFFLLGSGPMLWTITTLTLRQSVTPQPLLGRVSAMFLLATGGRPLGAAIGAGVGAMLGIEAALAVAAACFLAQMLIVLASPVVRLEAQPELALAR